MDLAVGACKGQQADPKPTRTTKVPATTESKRIRPESPYTAPAAQVWSSYWRAQIDVSVS